MQLQHAVKDRCCGYTLRYGLVLPCSTLVGCHPCVYHNPRCTDGRKTCVAKVIMLGRIPAVLLNELSRKVCAPWPTNSNTAVDRYRYTCSHACLGSRCMGPTLVDIYPPSLFFFFFLLFSFLSPATMIFKRIAVLLLVAACMHNCMLPASAQTTVSGWVSDPR